MAGASAILVAAALPWVGAAVPTAPFNVAVRVALTALSAGFAIVAVRSVAEQAARLVMARGGGAAAGTVRVLLVGGGYVGIAVAALGLLAVPVERLLVSGAIGGVILGIAGQQTLSNAFAGITIVFARPFIVGDHVGVRGGSLGGHYEGEVVDIGLMYTTLRTPEGLLNLPNSGVLSAVSGPSVGDHERLPLRDEHSGGATSWPALSPPSADHCEDHGEGPVRAGHCRGPGCRPVVR